MIIDDLRTSFNNTFCADPEILVKSPGRVNLIGEHIDYNGGTVLPATINNAIYLAVSKNEKLQIEVHAVDLNERLTITTEANQKTKQHWKNCVIGVWLKLKSLTDYPIGINISIISDLPIGSGLSSSSALCCGLIKAISSVYNIELTALRIAEIAFDVERNFIGIQCGFMDQFVICHGQKNKAVVLDTKTNDFEFIKIPVKKCEWVLIDSKINRKLHESEYNLRKALCDHMVEIANEHLGYVEYLVDLNDDDLLDLKSFVNKSDYQKALYVINEQKRVADFYHAMLANDLEDMGKLMYSCQDGLESQYQVSCWEIDTIIEACRKNPNIYGARMMGGGFGGCVLILAKSNTDYNSILKNYQDEFDIEGELIQIDFGDSLSTL